MTDRNSTSRGGERAALNSLNYAPVSYDADPNEEARKRKEQEDSRLMMIKK